LKIALGRDTGGYSWKGVQEAINRATKAGAIDPNVIPVHGEVVDFGTNIFNNVPLQQLSDWKNQLFDAGFTAYRSGDDFGRVIAYEAGRFRVNKHVGDFIHRRIDLETFKQRAKVKIHHEAIEAEFDRLVGEGLYDQAADYIGKSLADKVHFVYGNGNHPVGWNGPVGRLFGQFGTFPTQYLQGVIEGATRGTIKDRLEFITTHSAFNMGIVATGLAAFDADLTSWGMSSSLTYTGGPYADVFVHLAMMMSGNDAEQGLARRSLAFMLPSLEDPASIFVPGSYFVSDIVKAFDEEDPFSMILRASGIRTLGPGDRRPESALMNGLSWVNEIGP
jgi:hypothetical protein